MSSICSDNMKYLSYSESIKQRSDEASVDMILKDSQAFSVVEEGFRNYVDILDSTCTIPLLWKSTEISCGGKI